MSNDVKGICRHTLVTLAGAACLTLSPSLLAGDAANGEALYHEVEIERTIRGEAYSDANCETCHDPSLYMSEQRKVTTFAKLEAFVEGCNTNLDVGWFPEDVADVASYLNKKYYKFEE